MCWGIRYRICFTNLEKLNKKFDNSNYEWKEVDSAQKMIELCRKIGADIPESIAEFVASEKDSCLCLLTEEEKRVILGKLTLYAINRFYSIEIDWR